jgi:hypothetical protein
MRFSRYLAACAGLLLLAPLARAQDGDRITLEIDNPSEAATLIRVPLNLSDKYAKLTDLKVTIELPSGTAKGTALLMLPSLATEKAEALGTGKLRRDLWIGIPSKQKKLTIHLDPTPWGVPAAAYSQWKNKEGEYTDLVMSGKPVMRYVYKAYDNSKENRDKTYKVFHHLYDPTGKRFVTNGGDTNDPLPKNPKDLLYPHHRGLMYAFNKITYDDKKTCDTWHAKPGDTHEEHVKFLSEETGPGIGRHRVAVNWHGPKNEVFLNEERELTAFKMGKGVLVEFAALLKTPGGTVKLDGDPQHAGFQFRAHNDVAVSSKNDTYYLRPDGKGDFGEKGTRNWDAKKGGPTDLGWDACSFVLDGKRYTVVYMDHPKNPHPSRWSERDYARFGCYFEAEVTKERPLLVNYRVWLQEGEMTVEECEALYKAFTAPPKVTAK